MAASRRWIPIVGGLCSVLGALLTVFAITNLLISSRLAPDIAFLSRLIGPYDPIYLPLAHPYLIGAAVMTFAALSFWAARTILTGEQRPLVILLACLLILTIASIIFTPVYRTCKFCATFDILGYPVRDNTHGWLGPLPGAATACVDDIGKVYYWKCDDVSIFQQHFLGCTIWLRLMAYKPANDGVNLTVRPVTGLATAARPTPVQPAGYAGRWAAIGQWRRRMVRSFLQIAAPFILFPFTVFAASLPNITLYTDEEISAKYKAVTPRESDFHFSPPPAWSTNYASQATITLLTPCAGPSEEMKAIDGKPETTWTCHHDRATADIILDLGEPRHFNRVVIFNRQTDQRGTGGGNNAVKRITLSVAERNQENAFKLLGDYTLQGPAAVCFKRKAGGQVCAFIDRTEPNILELPATTGRFVRINLKEAFWGSDANPSWKTSIAVSEIMLFDCRDSR